MSFQAKLIKCMIPGSVHPQLCCVNQSLFSITYRLINCCCRLLTRFAEPPLTNHTQFPLKNGMINWQKCGLDFPLLIACMGFFI